ncbi:unnamed protein product [Rhizoctonia solani]|uniref:Uncharacterized protein n=1 Tax=Rhizoctonia solani TaxID=456999 RepID=A0A8H3C855_9AGAM|nr:unnamed protein product [Rhizoctonia solani]
MTESFKGLARDEVAARRAALTDGRWRNREGIGMYQRSTSNALRNILTGVKGAFPSFSRARSKSKSRSVSPQKRAALVSGNDAQSPQAGPSRLGPDLSPTRPSPSPARSTRSRRSSTRSKRTSSIAIPHVSPRTTSSPTKRLNPSPLRKSYLSPIRKGHPSPARRSNPSPLRRAVLSPVRPNPSPVRTSNLSPIQESIPAPTRRVSTARQKVQPRVKTKLKIYKEKEPEPESEPEPEPELEPEAEPEPDPEPEPEQEPDPEPTLPDSPKERRSVQAAETPEDDVPQDKSPPEEVEIEQTETMDMGPEPELEPEPDRPTSVQHEGVDDSIVVFEEDPPPEPPKVKAKAKAKGKAKSRVQPADDSVVIVEEPVEAPPPKKKGRIQTIVPEPVQRAKPAQSRKASGSKRPAVDDDAEGSPPKRAKGNKGKPKAKAPVKKGKTTKTNSRKKGVQRAMTVESEPEPERTTPAPQDIMVPLQDSPPPRPKDSKRRRYTLMPVRTTEEMSHPDYDPMDCIGWQ